MHDFMIESDRPTSAKVYMDGKPLRGVRSVSYKAEVNECSTVTIEFYARTLNRGYLAGLSDPSIDSDDINA